MKKSTKIKFAFFILFCSVGISNTWAQPNFRSLSFKFTFDGKEIETGKSVYWKEINDSIRFDNLKFYFSNVYFSKGGKSFDSLSKKYHLYDSEIDTSSNCSFNSVDYFICDSLHLTIGIDSITNVSGAMGGDLDPVNGMYWAWQSGYINFKIEGVSPLCNTRNHVFQYHIGGYSAPYASARKISFAAAGNYSVTLTIPLDELLKKIDIKTTNEVMSPGKKATEISDHLAKIIMLE